MASVQGDRRWLQGSRRPAALPAQLQLEAPSLLHLQDSIMELPQNLNRLFAKAVKAER